MAMMADRIRDETFGDEYRSSWAIAGAAIGRIATACSSGSNAAGSGASFLP